MIKLLFFVIKKYVIFLQIVKRIRLNLPHKKTIHD